MTTIFINKHYIGITMLYNNYRIERRLKMNKKLIMFLLVGILALAMVNAALVFYLSNTIRAEVEIDNPIECYFVESGTNYLDLGEITKTGSPINIGYTPMCENNAGSNVETYPVTIISGPASWEGNEFDSVWSCSPLIPLEESVGETTDSEGNIIPCIDVTDKLFYVDDYGNLHQFSEVGGDNNIYSTAKLFIDYDGDGVAQKYPLATGTTSEHMIITFNPNVAAGYYSMRFCHLNEITGQCQGYYYVYAVSE